MKLAIIFLLTALLSAGCATQRSARPDDGAGEGITEKRKARPRAKPRARPPSVEAPDDEPELTSPIELDPEEGGLSYYHDSLAGRRTASGERYDPRARTCAHRTHAFGTRLRVTVPATGASVECRVNDRGPFVKGRILDLSRRLAEELGMVQEGVVEGRVVRLVSGDGDG